MSKRIIPSLRKFMEDAPVNNVGDGKVAGLGVGPQGEPGGRKFILNKKLMKRNKPK